MRVTLVRRSGGDVRVHHFGVLCCWVLVGCGSAITADLSTFQAQTAEEAPDTEESDAAALDDATVADAVVSDSWDADDGVDEPEVLPVEVVDSDAGPDDGYAMDVPPDVPVGEGALVLNEVLARNASGLEDDDGKTSDWIELYNPGDGPMQLAGWALTDDSDTPAKWGFPDMAIEPGGYLVVFASGNDRRDPNAALHTNFKLSGDGEFLGLTDPNGTVVQSFGAPYPHQLSDISYGMHAEPGLYYLVPPTPGASNLQSIAAVGLAEVGFSHPSGVFTEPFDLTLTGPPGVELRVTLDGTKPTVASPTYAGPIPITATTQVRVAIVEEDGDDVRRASASYMWVEQEVATFQSNTSVIMLDSFGFDIDSEADLDERPFRPLTAVVVEDASLGLTGEIAWAGASAMHVRGSSSAQYPKKQYTFETRDEEDDDLAVPLLGMPADSDWILHAPYSDKSLMRNAMIYKWSNDIGRYAVRTRHIELFVAPHGGAVTMDDYRGVYVLMEKIKRGPERVNVSKLGKDDLYDPEVSGGYILKKDWYAEGFDTVIYQDHLIWVYPEVEDIEEEQAEWINGFFNGFEAALAGADFADPWKGYSQFIDVDSFIDHHLLVELARNVDGFVLSTYLHKERNGRIQMGPIWDYNGALGGANYFCSWLTEGWHHEFNESQCGGGGDTFPADNPTAYLWYERLFQDPVFAARYAERWILHRQGPLATAALHADIDAAAAQLAEAQLRNFERWDVLGTYVWPNANGWDERVTFEHEVDYLKTWLALRLAWMDSQLGGAP